jgi:pyridoxamine 5'-phosphate oxidase
MVLPFDLLHTWLAEEQTAGAPNPRQAVLSTAGLDGTPHARVVAIREIDDKGLLFFTQRGTRKVEELDHNPKATMTFWFELCQREVIIEGIAEPLTDTENDDYWQSYSREAQIRFYSYASTSTQPIDSKSVLEAIKKKIEQEYEGKPLPVSPFYCGFRIKPTRMMFYAYRTDELSDVFEYRLGNGTWTKQWLSP